MFNMYEVADRADAIIEGYAFERYEAGIRVTNLNNGHGVAVFSEEGKMIESNMDEIELSLAKELLMSVKKYMGEEAYA